MSADPFTGWAIIELLGRTRIAGHVAADAPLLQATRFLVSIYPGDAETPAATQIVYTPLWRITPCTEATARAVGLDTIRYSMPVAQWELPAAEQQPAIGPGGGDDPVEAIIHANDCADPDCDGDCDGDDG